MPVTTVPRFDLKLGVSIDDADRELTYILFGSEDEGAITDALGSEVPNNVGALFLQDVSVEHLGAGVWEAKARYGPKDKSKEEPQPEGEADAGTYSFDTGGGTQHITTGLSAKLYGLTGSPSDRLSGQPIGQTKDRVEGVDIGVPAFSWTESRVLPAAMVTQAYKLTLMGLSNSVNSAAFRGTAAGETLFKYASGKQDKIDKVEITFHFAASPNQTGLKFGDNDIDDLITGVAKKGWEYLEVLYRDKKSTVTNTLIKSPFKVIVHQVFPIKNFALLGIGT